MIVVAIWIAPTATAAAMLAANPASAAMAAARAVFACVAAAAVWLAKLIAAGVAAAASGAACRELATAASSGTTLSVMALAADPAFKAFADHWADWLAATSTPVAAAAGARTAAPMPTKSSGTVP